MNGRKAMRGLSALVLLGLLIGLAVVTVHRAWQKRPSQTAMDAGQVLGGNVGGAVGVFTGFKYVERVKGQLIFALEALQSLGLSSGWQDIEGVSLQLYNDDETRGPHLTCRKASFNVDSKDARLNGSVQVEFPDGSFLSTEVGLLRDGGSRFETLASVTFVGRGLLGHAGSARYELEDQILQLGGGVAVQTDGGGGLVARNIVYRRNGHLLILPDGGRLTFGSSVLTAPYGEVFLEESGGLPRALSFRGGVSIHTVDLATGQIIDLWSEKLRCEKDASGRWHLDGSTSRRWVELSIVGGENFLAQELKAWSLRAVTDEGGLLNLRAEGRVCIESIPYDGPPRVGTADKLKIWFRQGRATDIEFQQDVNIREGDLQASANRARVDGESGQVMLQGDPTGKRRVTIRSPRGRLTADQGVFTHATGGVDIRGRVQGEMFGAEMIGNRQVVGSDEESVHLACDRLTVSDGAGTYHLRGNARAWQGQRLLVGDEIEYWPNEGKMESRGHTRTTFPASMLDPESGAGEDVVLVARHMVFDEAQRRAHYRGGVVYSDPEHRLSASDLEILFGPENEVQSVIATGSVEIESLETGQKLTGSKAIRDILTRVVLLTGEPAQATDAEGNRLSGHSLTWDQAGDRVLVSEDTETIFHPEEEP